MALSRDIVIRMIGDAESAVKAQKAAADAAEVSVAAYRKAEREYARQQDAMEAASRKQRAAMEKVGAGAAAFGAAVVSGLGMAVKAAMDWESAWAGVTKTVNGTDKQLAAIEGGLRGLARTLPATHTEIAAVAEAAGQLGVKTEGIVDFTRTMIDLGETTNLTADEAATSLAQLMNVMGTSSKDVGRLGATLVALGNAGASTEADILKMASYLTGSAKLIGASSSDVLALSNAMTSMGINAERGGGVMTRVMQDIYGAVQSGGKQLDGFAKVAGMSSAQFAQAFRDDPIRAIDTFVQGLNTVESSGGNVVETLNNLGYVGTQDTAVLLQLKGAGDLTAQSLDLANKSWEQNTALVQEAAKRYDTTASKMEIARNNITEAGIEIGQTLLPVLASVAESVADLAQWFADLPDPVKDVLATLGAVAGVASLAGGAFLLLFPRVMETVQAFRALSATGGRAQSAMSGMGKAAGVAAAVMVLGAAVSALDSAMAPTPATMEEMTNALLKMDGSTAAIDKRFRSLGKGIDAEFSGFGDALKRVTDPSNVERLNDFGGALFNVVSFGTAGTGKGAASRRRVLDEIKGIDQALGVWVSSGQTELAAQQFGLMADEAQRNGVSLAELKKLFPEYQGALKGIENDQKAAAASAGLQAAATMGIGPAANSVYASLETYAAGMGLSDDATKDLIKSAQELGKTLADFIDPLGVYTGMLDEKAAREEEAARKAAEAAGAGADSWRDFVKDTGFSFDEYMRRLEEQVKAQDSWQLNMLRLAGRVSQGTLAELAKMGPEGAPLVADLVNKSDAELSKFDGVMRRRSKEATDAWGEQLTLAQPVLTQIAKKAGQGVVDELTAKLQAGTITVAQIAAQYGIALAGGINPLLVALGKNRIQGVGGRVGGFTEADGGVVDYYANGGVENHTAQIAPAGAWRVWAEPETGGEAYIPLSPAKRSRSVGIWQETGRRLGVYANGGFWTPESVPRPPSTAPYGAPISTAGDATMAKGYEDTVAWVRANMEQQGSGGSASGLLPIMAAARQYVMDTYGVRNIGGFARRNIAGTKTLSDHAMGKAIDVMTSNLALGWAVARDFAFGDAHSRFRAENVIWQQSISSNGRPFVGMADRGSPTQNHRDHVHVDTYDSGGWLRPGYTLAYNGTGRPERVLTSEQARGIPAGSGIPVGSASRTSVNVGAPNVTVHARVFVGDREITDIARVEVESALTTSALNVAQTARFGVR